MRALRSILMTAIVAGAVGAPPATAYAEGLFGGRGSPDGAINIRRSTSEPFDPIRGQAVSERPRPDFDPTPIDVGSFQFYPTWNVSTFHDDNIFSTETDEESDMVVRASPSFSLLSNWGRHAVATTVLGDVSFYNDNDDEDTQNGAVQVEGRFDIDEFVWLAAHAGYQASSEPRSAATAIGNAEEPTRFFVTTAGLTGNHGVGKVKLRADWDLRDYDYSNPDLTGGGQVDLSGRDRQDNIFTGEIGYEVSPNFIPFVRAVYDDREYDDNSLRDSEGYSVVAGAELDFGGITTLEIYAGYLERDYDRFADGNEETVDFGADLTWNVTELTSIQASADRGIEETTVGGIASAAAASSYTRTGTSLAVTHELMRSVLVEANMSFENNDYNNLNREDDVYGAGLGGRYFINRNAYADATYTYRERDSSQAGSDYDKNIFLLSVGLQY